MVSHQVGRSLAGTSGWGKLNPGAGFGCADSGGTENGRLPFGEMTSSTSMKFFQESLRDLYALQKFPFLALVHAPNIAKNRSHQQPV